MVLRLQQLLQHAARIATPRRPPARRVMACAALLWKCLDEIDKNPPYADVPAPAKGSAASPADKKEDTVEQTPQKKEDTEAAPANVRIYVTKPHRSVLCSFDCEMFEPYQDEPQSSMQN